MLIVLQLKPSHLYKAAWLLIWGEDKDENMENIFDEQNSISYSTQYWL